MIMTPKKTIQNAVSSLQNTYPRAHYQGFLLENNHELLSQCLDKEGFSLEVERAISWFENNPRMKVLSRKNDDADLGSLKHSVERWVNNIDHRGYISRGAVLVAAECLGIPHSRDKLHISMAAVEWPRFKKQ